MSTPMKYQPLPEKALLAIFAERDTLQAENTRLREALELIDIANRTSPVWPPKESDWLDILTATRAALAPATPTQESNVKTN